MNFTQSFLAEAAEIISKLDADAIERMASRLAEVRALGGRLFILGVGGSAANASHAVNDFRKLTEFETYAPTDNVSELTARTNDEGWTSVFEGWLRISRLGPKDAVLVLSVGGGSAERQVSTNLVAALDYARSVGASLLGIVGRDGGYTATVSDICVIVPTVNADHVTPHSEAMQAVVWHLLVSHPALKRIATKWESVLPDAPSGRRKRRAVFFDRDGVLNEPVMLDGKPFPPSNVDELQIVPRASQLLCRLRDLGFLLVTVTNQPDVARGMQSRTTVEQINQRLRGELPIDDVLVCYHDDSDGCDCRKPRPGLLTRAAEQHTLDLRRSYLVGDRWRDIDAGASAGCRTVWIDNRYAEQKPHTAPDARVSSLDEAVDWIVHDSVEQS